MLFCRHDRGPVEAGAGAGGGHRGHGVWVLRGHADGRARAAADHQGPADVHHLQQSGDARGSAAAGSPHRLQHIPRQQELRQPGMKPLQCMTLLVMKGLYSVESCFKRKESTSSQILYFCLNTTYTSPARAPSTRYETTTVYDAASHEGALFC